MQKWMPLPCARQVFPELVPTGIDAVGAGEDTFVPVRGAQVHHHAGALGQLDAADLGRPGRDAEEALGRRLQAEDLLDRRRRELRIEQMLAQLGIGGRRATSALPIARGHRHVARDDQVERQSRDGLAAAADRRTRPARPSSAPSRSSRGLPLALLEGVDHVALQRDEPASVAYALLDRSRLLEQQPVRPPLVQPGEVLARESEQLAEHS